MTKEKLQDLEDLLVQLYADYRPDMHENDAVALVRVTAHVGWMLLQLEPVRKAVNK